jgi:predicted nuclease of predicted toxin-antitoxin system
VRFLIDNSLSPRLASLLGELGHDAVHLRSFGKQDAEDLEVFEIAASQDRVIVAQDTDFGAIIAARRSTKLSLTLFRREDHSTEGSFAIPRDNLSTIEHDLSAGAIVVIDDTRIRVRALPLA